MFYLRHCSFHHGADLPQPGIAAIATPPNFFDLVVSYMECHSRSLDSLYQR